VCNPLGIPQAALIVLLGVLLLCLFLLLSQFVSLVGLFLLFCLFLYCCCIGVGGVLICVSVLTVAFNVSRSSFIIHLRSLCFFSLTVLSPRCCSVWDCHAYSAFLCNSPLVAQNDDFQTECGCGWTVSFSHT